MTEININLAEINNQIKALQLKAKAISDERDAEFKRLVEEGRGFHNKIKTTKNVDFMKEILTVKSVVNTPKYGWQEFYSLCENPNINDEIIDILLTKEARSQIVCRLILNNSLSYLQVKRVLKSDYFFNLKQQYNQRITNYDRTREN